MPDHQNTVCYHLENLVADDASLARSPLAAGLSADGVELIEQALLGHLVLRVDNPSDSFKGVINSCLHAELPTVALSSSESDEATICWVSPNEWLIVVSADKIFAIESQLRSQLSGHYALVNVSGGQTCLVLSGSNALNVLRKSASYDFASLTAGGVVTTNLAASQALIRKLENGAFQLIIRRSFADYLYAWIADAAKEYSF